MHDDFGLYQFYHDSDEHHLHDEEADTDLEHNGLWVADNVELTSVGIDIGSASTQVIFSKLTLRRMGGDLSSRYNVVARESLYRSAVELTPYLDEHQMDEQTLGDIVDQAFREFGVKPENVDTGAVILTGEAIRRRNAEAIADVMSHRAGQFVCATAGHNMEAMLAAYGSGAVYASYEQGTRILNVDIGGGTTKLALVEDGRVVETAALQIGSRLVAVDGDGYIVRLEQGGRDIARMVGLALELGTWVSPEDLQKMGQWMAQTLLSVIAGETMPEWTQTLFLTDIPTSLNLAAFHGVMFSGGVSEYVYGSESRDFGDLGKSFGEALSRTIKHHPRLGQLLPSVERIRATVVGASEYSLQLSGNTIYVSHPQCLPIRNLQVLHPDCDLRGDIDARNVSQSILDHFRRFDIESGSRDIALSFHWNGPPAYERIAAFVNGVEQAVSRMQSKRPVTLVFDGDVAQTVGRLLREEQQVDNPLLILDGIGLQDFDYIDIGRFIQPAGVVPVTIKSLIFLQGH